MGRPATHIDLATGARKKDEIENRKKAEDKLRGTGDIAPPPELSEEQREIFENIVQLMKEADVLSCLDTYILTRAAVTIDALNEIDEMIRNDGKLFLNAPLMSARNKYTQEFFRCCNELGLSPQARAKMAIAFSRKEEDELMTLLNGDDENAD